MPPLGLLLEPPVQDFRKEVKRDVTERAGAAGRPPVSAGAGGWAAIFEFAWGVGCGSVPGYATVSVPG